MTAIIDFFVKWAALISEMFKKYPLPAAVVTLAAVLVFVQLQKERNPNKDNKTSVINAFLVLLGWAIIVPIIGTILDVVVWIAKALLSALSFLYGAYQKHPLFVLGAVVTAVIAYLIWEWRVKPRQPFWRAAVTF